MHDAALRGEVGAGDDAHQTDPGDDQGGVGLLAALLHLAVELAHLDLMLVPGLLHLSLEPLLNGVLLGGPLLSAGGFAGSFGLGGEVDRGRVTEAAALALLEVEPGRLGTGDVQAGLGELRAQLEIAERVLPLRVALGAPGAPDAARERLLLELLAEAGDGPGVDEGAGLGGVVEGGGLAELADLVGREGERGRALPAGRGGLDLLGLVVEGLDLGRAGGGGPQLGGVLAKRGRELGIVPDTVSAICSNVSGGLGGSAS